MWLTPKAMLMPSFAMAISGTGLHIRGAGRVRGHGGSSARSSKSGLKPDPHAGYPQRGPDSLMFWTFITTRIEDSSG